MPGLIYLCITAFTRWRAISRRKKQRAMHVLGEGRQARRQSDVMALALLHPQVYPRVYKNAGAQSRKPLGDQPVSHHTFIPRLKLG
jgi:arginine exporter protein ArgO